MIRRIAISGSAGTGKSTLGIALSERLGLNFLKEGMRSRLEEGLNFHDLSTEEFVDLQLDLWKEHVESCDAQLGGFVVDRCCADFAAFRLHYNLIYPEEEAHGVISGLLESFHLYDRVILVPFGVFPIPEDGVRSPNRWTQFRFHAILEGLLSRYAPKNKVIWLPSIDGLEERVQFICDKLVEA